MAAYMNIYPLHTEADCRATRKEIAALLELDPDVGTPAGDRVDIMATLAQTFEVKLVPNGAPDPVEAICLNVRTQADVVMTVPLAVSAEYPNSTAIDTVRSRVLNDLRGEDAWRSVRASAMKLLLTVCQLCGSAGLSLRGMARVDTGTGGCPPKWHDSLTASLGA